jgi:hypothetical protein
MTTNTAHNWDEPSQEVDADPAMYLRHADRLITRGLVGDEDTDHEHRMRQIAGGQGLALVAIAHHLSEVSRQIRLAQMP